jgi:hypothetical protein
MGNFILIFVYLFSGLALQKVKFIPLLPLNYLIKLGLILPSGFSSYIQNSLNNQLLYPIGAAWIGFELLFYSFIF